MIVIVITTVICRDTSPCPPMRERQERANERNRRSEAVKAKKRWEAQKEGETKPEEPSGQAEQREGYVTGNPQRAKIASCGKAKKIGRRLRAVEQK